MTINVDKLIEEIENYRAARKMEYLDAIIEVCKIKGIDVETIAQILKKNTLMREKLQFEAENNHQLKRTTSRLPV
jgi:hypothetical protein